MIKQTLQAIVFGGALMAAGASQAGLYWDVDVFSLSEGYVSVGNSLQDSFDITENRLGGNFVGSLDGGNEAVTSVLFEFTLIDDKDGFTVSQSESWQIDLAGESVGSGSSSGWFGVLYFGFGSANVRADIEADGKVDYEISATTGDFRVINAAITVCTETHNYTTSVPDGGMTLALLGAGLLGLAAVRRRC